MLQKLDVAVEAYLERQQLINLLAIPGTILFLMLFWAFSGAGGVVVFLDIFELCKFKERKKIRDLGKFLALCIYFL